MNIIIVGAGVVGSTLAEELSDDGHNVSIIDQDAKLIKQLRERMDVLAVRGNGAQLSTLRQAGIDDAQMIISVTDNDEVNLVISMVAKKVGVEHKIARLRDDEYMLDEPLLSLDEIGIDTVIHPERLLVATLKQVLDIPGATDVASFADGKILLVMFDVTEEAPLAGKQLSELRDAAKMHSFLVVSIFRNNKPFVPRGDDRIRAGDEIGVILRTDHVDLFLPLVSSGVRRCERLVIYGGDRVGLRLAKDLQRQLQKVALIEPNQEDAEAAAADLPDTLVLHGGGTDPDVMSEADVAHCDYFMALSRDDEANLFAALMAKRCGAPRVAVITQSPDYVPILDNIGMDVVLNPRLATVGEILRFLRKGQIHTITRLKESEAEVIELEAVEGSKITKKDLKNIEFPEGSIVAAVVRDDEMVIPDGNFRVQPGEHVVIFALQHAITAMEKLFNKRGLLG